MMKTVNGERVPVVPRQLSTGQWIAEMSDTCFGFGDTPDAALRDLCVACGGGRFRVNAFRGREVLVTDFGVITIDCFSPDILRLSS